VVYWPYATPARALLPKYTLPLEKGNLPFTIPLKKYNYIVAIYRGTCSKSFKSSTDGKQHFSTCQKLVMLCFSSCVPSVLL
jgi:hypothetical protein